MAREHGPVIERRDGGERAVDTRRRQPSFGVDTRASGPLGVGGYGAQVDEERDRTDWRQCRPVKFRGGEEGPEVTQIVCVGGDGVRRAAARGQIDEIVRNGRDGIADRINEFDRD